MQILNWIPPHAQQVRYIAPYYEEDRDGDRICINEGEATSVWFDIIEEVHKTKRPMYYRRRTTELARRDKHSYQRSIFDGNTWRDDWKKQSIHVRVKVIGKRVLFIYDEEFVHKNWIAEKKKKELRIKIDKLRKQKFKDYGKKILKDSMDEFTEWLDKEAPEMAHELVEAVNEGRSDEREE